MKNPHFNSSNFVHLEVGVASRSGSESWRSRSGLGVCRMDRGLGGKPSTFEEKLIVLASQYRSSRMKENGGELKGQ